MCLNYTVAGRGDSEDISLSNLRSEMPGRLHSIVLPLVRGFRNRNVVIGEVFDYAQIYFPAYFNTGVAIIFLSTRTRVLDIFIMVVLLSTDLRIIAHAYINIDKTSYFWYQHTFPHLLNRNLPRTTSWKPEYRRILQRSTKNATIFKGFMFIIIFSSFWKWYSHVGLVVVS